MVFPWLLRISQLISKGFITRRTISDVAICRSYKWNEWKCWKGHADDEDMS